MSSASSLRLRGTWAHHWHGRLCYQKYQWCGPVLRLVELVIRAPHNLLLVLAAINYCDSVYSPAAYFCCLETISMTRVQTMNHNNFCRIRIQGLVYCRILYYAIPLAIQVSEQSLCYLTLSTELLSPRGLTEPFIILNTVEQTYVLSLSISASKSSLEIFLALWNIRKLSSRISIRMQFKMS